MNRSEIHTRLLQLDERFIRRRIRLLLRTDLRKARIDSVRAHLGDLMKAYGMYPLNIRAGESVYRARKHREDEKTINLPDLKENIYPQPRFIRRLGRANRAHHPIYYFAGNEGIALNEVKPVEGDVITILECKPHTDVVPQLVHIGIHQMTERHRVRIGGDFPDPATRIRELFQNDTESILKHKMIDDFVATEFLKNVDDDNEEHLYKLTIAIAEWLFSFETDLGPVDGLAYPSLASQKINANVAYLPAAFERLYRPNSCKRVTICGVGEKIVDGLPVNGFSITDERIAQAVRDDGHIDW